MVQAAGHKLRRAWLWPLREADGHGSSAQSHPLAGGPHSTEDISHPEVASFAGGEGRALILDTEGTFRPERILEISKRFDLNGEDVLNNIRVSRVRCRGSLEQRPQSQRARGIPHAHTLMRLR